MKHVLRALAVDGDRPLAQFVALRLELPASVAAEHLRRGSVYVDGRRQRDGRTRLLAGQKVTVHDLPATQEVDAPPARAVYVDADLAVFDKPAGMPSIATRAGGEVTLEDRAREQLGSGARLLHRLDRGASGLLLVTRTARARQSLDEQLRAHAVERRYFALTGGRPSQRRWVVDRPLSRAQGVARVSAAGKPARTHVELLLQADGVALLAVRLETGRMHQIRAHLASEGLPLLGDTRYGGPPGPRLGLHAHRLRFTHPSGQLLDVHSPLPRQLRVLVGDVLTRSGAPIPSPI